MLLHYSKCGLSHTSPCDIKSDIARTFLHGCQVEVSCACDGAVKCGAGTGTYERIGLLGVNGNGENIVYGVWGVGAFRLWL